MKYLLTIIFTSTVIFAQVSIGGNPIGFNPDDIPSITMPAVDVDAIRAEEARLPKDTPYRFGADIPVNINLQNAGIWQEQDDGSMIWALELHSLGAFSLNLLYDDFYLPKGAKFFLYTPSQNQVLGAFTEANNKADGKFATAPSNGDCVILEYYEPANERGNGRISIHRLVHAYQDIFYNDRNYGDSGSCNNNVNCAVGEDWQDEKRAVAMILTGGGFRICTGALVNNTEENFNQYFLTANHCLGGETSWIFMFNYESPTCTNQNGPTWQTTQGANLRATYANSDFALLELTEDIPESYGVFYAGWNRVNSPSDNSTCIHHPSGDIKKISFDYQSPGSSNYGSGSGGSHWKIFSWEDGTTEGGSSGSPLFDQNHRITGQLHGGEASCNYNYNDYFGKFAQSWDGGGSSYNSLQSWLDPNSSGVTYLDGIDPNEEQILLGDVNFDEIINVLDIISVANIIMGDDNPSPQEFEAADMNSDGVINVQDIVLIANIILTD